jgi:hypothetical protein
VNQAFRVVFRRLDLFCCAYCPTTKFGLKRLSIKFILGNLLTSIYTPVEIAKLKKGTDFQKRAMGQLCRVFQKIQIKTLHSQLCRVFWSKILFLLKAWHDLEVWKQMSISP